ncbi:MAG: MetS family NSS transporter small subunit [Bacteroidota bacterium]
MSGSAILSMVLILGIIVGGFLFFLVKAIRKENRNNG